MGIEPRLDSIYGLLDCSGMEWAPASQALLIGTFPSTPLASDSYLGVVVVSLWLRQQTDNCTDSSPDMAVASGGTGIAGALLDGY